MNFYHLKTRESNRKLTLEEMSEFLPENVYEAGFVCPICEKSMRRNGFEMCSWCKNELCTDTNNQTLIFTISKELDLNKNPLDTVHNEIVLPDMTIKISRDKYIYHAMVDTLQSVYKGEDNLYHFSDSE